MNFNITFSLVETLQYACSFNTRKEASIIVDFLMEKDEVYIDSKRYFTKFTVLKPLTREGFVIQVELVNDNGYTKKQGYLG